MADETETGAPIAVVETEALAQAPALKKQRAPRRSKAEIDAAATVRSPKVRQKRTTKAEVAPASAEATAPAVIKKASVKSSAKAKLVTQAAAATTSVTTIDEMADLLQLEEENKKLRHSLAEMLRAENSDLRKRLGV